MHVRVRTFARCRRAAKYETQKKSENKSKWNANKLVGGAIQPLSLQTFFCVADWAESQVCISNDKGYIWFFLHGVWFHCSLFFAVDLWAGSWFGRLICLIICGQQWTSICYGRLFYLRVKFSIFRTALVNSENTKSDGVYWLFWDFSPDWKKTQFSLYSDYLLNLFWFLLQA